jgi:hypothetical protein
LIVVGYYIHPDKRPYKMCFLFSLLGEELKERARLNPRRRRRRRRITDAPTEQPNTRPNQSPPYLQARKDLKRVVDGRFTEYRGYRAPNLRVQTVYYLREGPPQPDLPLESICLALIWMSMTN